MRESEHREKNFFLCCCAGGEVVGGGLGGVGARGDGGWQKHSTASKQLPLDIISTHIRAAQSRLCQWKISEKLVEGVVVDFSVRFALFLRR